MMDIVHFNTYYLPKISSGLSIIGSSIVLTEVMLDIHDKRRISSVSRMLAHVSMGDILFSLAWFIGTWAAPSDLDYLDGTNHGTYQSCRFQGFLVQLGGFTTMCFNPLLAVIYLLMINYNWRETKLYKLELILQAMVWTTALILAILPLPLDAYHNGGILCQIDSYPYNCTESWMLEDSSQEGEGETVTTTDCTAGDNAGFYRRIITLFISCGGLISTFIIFGFMYRKMRRLELESESIARQQRHALPAYSSSAAATCPDGSMNRHQPCTDQGKDPTLATQTLSRPEFLKEENLDNNPDNDDEEGGDASSRSDDDDLEQESGIKPSSTVASSTVTSEFSRRRKGSRIVAREGVLYTAGFLVLFVPWIASVLVLLVTGSWNGPLDRASVFFATIQGAWNCLVFGRKREMRTTAGKQINKLLRLGPYVSNAIKSWTTGKGKRSGSFDSRPQISKSKDDCRGKNIRGGTAGGDQRHQQIVPPKPLRESPNCSDDDGFVVQWKPSQIQDISELGASEVCYTEANAKWDSSIRENHRRRHHHHHDCTSPPFQPIRCRSEDTSSVSSYGSEKYPGSIRSSASSSSRTRSRYSKNNSNDSLDSAPVRPIRTISEVSALESIDENLEMMTCQKYPGNIPAPPVDCPPFRPNRTTSEVVSELESIDENYSDGIMVPSLKHQHQQIGIVNSVPSHPIRLESEYEAEEYDPSTNDQLSDSAPRKASRWGSEIDESSYDEDCGACSSNVLQRVSVKSNCSVATPASDSSAMPQKPIRCASDTDQSSSSEEDEEEDDDNNIPAPSSAIDSLPHHQPSGYICEIEGMEEGTAGSCKYSTSAGGSIDSDFLPRQPKRFASEVEDFDC